MKKIIKYVPFDTFFMFYISLFNISNFEVDVTVACFRNIDQCKCGISMLTRNDIDIVKVPSITPTISMGRVHYIGKTNN